MHVPKTIVEEVVKDSGITSLGNIPLEEMYGHAEESPFDTELEIKFIDKEKVDQATYDDVVEITLIGSSMDAEFQKVGSDLESMPDDEIESISGFETVDDDEDNKSEHKQELSKTEEANADNVISELVDMATSQDTNLNAFVYKPSNSDPFGHLQTDISSLVAKVNHLKKFNALNTMESERFVILQKKLGKAIRTTVGKSIQRNVKKQIGTMNELLRWNAKHQMQLIQYLEQLVHSQVRVPRDIMVINAKQLQTKVEKSATNICELVELTKEIVRLMNLAPAFNTEEQVTTSSTNTKVPTPAQVEQESSDQVVQTSTALLIYSSEEPPVKKPKVVLDNFHIPSPTPLNSIRPSIIINNILCDQFTANLFSSGSSDLSPTPPPKVVDKGKGIASEDDQMKQLMPFMGQGWSALKISNLHQFSAVGEGPLSIEKAKAQMEEIKSSATELAAYEAKRAKMMEQYNHYINFRDDSLPITKFNYRLHALASKSKTKANDQLLKNLKAKFQWVVTQPKTLGISPLPELTSFKLPSCEKKMNSKRKRRVGIIQEVFIKEDIVVDEMHRNLVPLSGVVASEGLVIREPESGTFFYSGNFDLNAIRINSLEAKEMYNKLNFVMEARNDVIEAGKIVLDNLDNLG
ncbi:hypothetical protein Tco_0144137 [Tanacetum coccineum]